MGTFLSKKDNYNLMCRSIYYFFVFANIEFDAFGCFSASTDFQLCFISEIAQQGFWLTFFIIIVISRFWDTQHLLHKINIIRFGVCFWL